MNDLRRFWDLLASAAWCGALIAGSAAIDPVEALTIVPTFTSSISGATNATTIESSIDAAIGTINSLYSNPGTVNIVYSACGGSGAPGCGGSFLAESNTVQVPVSYSSYTALLASNSASHPTNTTLATAIANLASGNKPGPGGSVMVTTADTQVVLGLATTGCYTSTGAFVGACGQAFDGVVTLNTGLPLNYTTTPAGGQFSAIATMEHETNEILGGGGQGSALNNIPCGGSKTAYPNVGVLDLYRYSAPGVPSFSSCNGTSAYLSVDGGVTDIVDFNNNPAADLADFDPNGFVQSAFASEGIVPSYTTASPEFPMMQSIGYDGFSSSVPEPASMVLLGSGLAGLLTTRRRRAGKVQ